MTAMILRVVPAKLVHDMASIDLDEVLTRFIGYGSLLGLSAQGFHSVIKCFW